jgi:hypothetical protein
VAVLQVHRVAQTLEEMIQEVDHPFADHPFVGGQLEGRSRVVAVGSFEGVRRSQPWMAAVVQADRRAVGEVGLPVTVVEVPAAVVWSHIQQAARTREAGHPLGLSRPRSRSCEHPPQEERRPAEGRKVVGGVIEQALGRCACEPVQQAYALRRHHDALPCRLSCRRTAQRFPCS